MTTSDLCTSLKKENMKIKSNVENLFVLYEDNHLIVINKRAGDIVQGDKTGDIPLSEIVKAYLKQKYGKPGEVFLGVVHRLDRPTTGIVVFAKTSKALTRLNALFARHQPAATGCGRRRPRGPADPGPPPVHHGGGPAVARRY